MRGGPDSAVRDVSTVVSEDAIAAVGHSLSTVPPSFTPHPKLVRLLKDRAAMAAGDKPMDWGMAEALAFGTLLGEGIRVRMSGQDVRRGTFSHRHSVLVDYNTGAEYTPLEHVAEDQGALEIRDSALSEAGALGFEYGYSLDMPEGLVIWEAQFGDFVNGAQVIIDQFLVSSEAKWNRVSGLVLLLPHGMEGQGPEHSSGRLERFLNMCVNDNIQVCNVTTPAQFFHLLRRQVMRPYRKPLIVMSPKSLLRHPAVVSTREELTRGRFQHVIPDTTVDPRGVDRVLLCSGQGLLRPGRRPRGARPKQRGDHAGRAALSTAPRRDPGKSLHVFRRHPGHLGAGRGPQHGRLDLHEPGPARAAGQLVQMDRGQPTPVRQSRHRLPVAPQPRTCEADRRGARTPPGQRHRRQGTDQKRPRVMSTLYLKVPALGESIAEAMIGKWKRAEGESVKADEPLVEVESDKATVELPAPGGGVLRRILHKSGATVAIGEVIAEIEEGATAAAPAGNGAAAAKAAGGTPQPGPEVAQLGAPTPTLRPDGKAQPAEPADDEPEHEDGGAVKGSPAVRRLMAEKGLSAHDVRASGPGGRIERGDVERALEARRQASEASSEALSEAVRERSDDRDGARQGRPARPPASASAWSR